MALRFVPFEPSHLRRINVQKQQRAELQASLEGARLLAYCGVAMTAIGAPSLGSPERVVASAGIVHKWRGLASIWALIGRDAQPHEWIAIVRRVRAGLEAAHRAGVRRIEGQADAEFRPACRMFELLEFDEPRVLLRAYSPLGRDCWLYARVRDCPGPIAAAAMEKAA